MSRSHGRGALVSIGLLAAVLSMAALEGCRVPDLDRPEIVRPRATGGVVNGSLYYAPPATDDVNKEPEDVIFLPDIEVFLHKVSTGADSAPVTTDLYGRYLFRFQPPGTYELRWNAQRGWAAGKHPDPVVIASGPRFPVPVQIHQEKTSGVVFGRVTLGDGGTPWSYDELFAVNHTATVTFLNAARTATLAGPLRANFQGSYAAAGLPRGQLVTIRAQSQASSVTRAVSAASVSMGNPVSPTDVKLPNARPEIVSVVPKMGGVLVQTAATGDTISLTAVTRDLNGDPLTHDWIVLPGNGSLVPAAGASANWQLPSMPGRHSAYLQVRDGRGGYARHRIDFVTGKKEATFSGRAVDKISGAPVGGADVAVNGVSTTTDANGFFRVKSPLSDRYVLNIARQGFALFSRVVDSEATGQTWPLVKAQSQPVNPNETITLVDQRPELERRKMKGVRITVPPRALVGPTGLAPTGMLTAYVATLDISDGEAPGDWGAMLAGSETNLISYGAAFVEFRDGAGALYKLAPGKEADVEMFAPSTMIPGAPANARLWSYDEADGYWKESGTSNFSTATGSFVGRVKHFSTINTDLEKDDAACLKVLIYPPISTGVKLRVTDPTDAVFTQSFEFVLDAGINAVYRLPANTNVQLDVLKADGSPYGPVLLEEVPGVPLSGNIVNTGPPIPAGQTLWPPEPYETCKLVILREPNEPTALSFLNFKDAGTAAQAEAYYDAVDPDENGDGVGERETLGAWWSKNGFIFGADGVPTNAVRTSYLNFNDLGSGRDMYFLRHPDGTAAAYVTNYGKFNQDPDNADLAATRDTPGATVCMEYGPVFGQGTTRIVKFFVFAGAGGGATAPRQPGADLDDFGVKFVPNLCLNCHGGNYRPDVPAAPTFAETNMGASFRELDIATYKFPGGRPEANAAEKTAFRDQNLIVKGAAADTISIKPIKDLIAGWYPGASTDQDNTYTPPGWVGAPQQNLYHDVVKPSCRTCHVALDADITSDGFGWITYDQLKQRRSFLLKNFALCESRIMPHAVITYRNFWLSASPHRPAVLRDFTNGSGWPAMGPCQ